MISGSWRWPRIRLYLDFILFLINNRRQAPIRPQRAIRLFSIRALPCLVFKMDSHRCWVWLSWAVECFSRSWSIQFIFVHILVQLQLELPILCCLIIYFLPQSIIFFNYTLVLVGNYHILVLNWRLISTFHVYLHFPESVGKIRSQNFQRKNFEIWDFP